MTRDRSNSNCLFLGELLFQHCPLFAAMASLCPGTYIGVFRASTEAAPPATISSIIIMAIITYTTAITSITYRCLTTTTGTTRATKAATTPSPHLADSGIVRLGFWLTLLITYFSKWLCWADNNLKVCLELGRQGDIQELQRPERTGRWQLPKKRGVLEFLCFLSNTYTLISYTFYVILILWFLILYSDSQFLSQVTGEGWMDGASLSLPQPCPHPWSCRCFQTCK